MNTSQQRRQELYDKIRQSSKQEYILSEMKRLGFWTEKNIDFQKVESYLKEERELSSQLQKLFREKKTVENPEEFIAQKHLERKKASKEKQKETKLKREQARQLKAEKWQKTKAEDIIYLGKNYSHQLNHKESDKARLQKFNLPVFDNAKDLADAIKISVGLLRFLAYSRKYSKTSHYKRFKIAKKTGGFRLISAPMPRLKQAQHYILEHLLNKVAVHPKANGCVKKKSIVSNAKLHLDKDVVINQDLKNFFPTITYKRVKGVFKSLGYSEQISVILALLCTEPKIMDVDVLGENYYAQIGERFLPQGSPCSPAITNILCRKLDYRLDGLAKHYGFEYSRYVDDITFSGTKNEYEHITSILKYSKKIVSEENFILHPDKLRIMKKKQKQEVTGIVVNKKLNIDRKTLKRFRALLFQIEKDGIEGKSWNGGSNVLAQIDGFSNFVYQVDKEKGQRLKDRVKKILESYGYKEQHKAKYVTSIPKSQAKQSFFGKILSFFKRKN